jgi:hypothetical protein
MSTKKLLLRPVAERFFVSISSPLFADGSRSLERFFSGLLFRSLGSFSGGDSARRFLKLGKRFNPVATMVLSEASWPIAISGSPRGHSVRTVTRCRSTQGRTTYLILPSNRASQELNRPPSRMMERALYQNAQAACRCNSLASKQTPFFQIVKVIAAIFRARVRRAIVGLLPLARSPA